MLTCSDFEEVALSPAQAEAVGGEGTDMTEANGPAEPSTAGSGRLVSEPVPPEQSHEDTDVAWGDVPESDDDRLYRDRPPHWDDF